MRIIVISLPDAVERRAQVTRQMKAHGIEFEFLDATTGDEALGEHRYRVKPWDFVIQCGRLPTPGEIGCFASHCRAWQQCVSDNEPIVVLEDDVEILRDFSAAICHLRHRMHQYGFVRLAEEKKGRGHRIAKFGEFSLSLYTRAPQGAIAYAISPVAATKLIAHCRRTTAPIDVLMKQFWLHRQRMFGLQPSVARHSALGLESHIPGRVKAKKSPWVRVCRTWHKLGVFIDRHRFNWCHRYDALRYREPTCPTSWRKQQQIRAKSL